jgi:DNA-binding transcriptional ArsR family regulator
VKAAALLEPQRMRMLEMLASPDSASGLARRLELPRQQVNYHLRELERAGLVRLVEERRKGNCLERIMEATARSYLLSPDLAGKRAAFEAEARDRFSSGWLIALAGRMLCEVADFCEGAEGGREQGERAEAVGKGPPTLALSGEIQFASADARAAFAAEMSEAFARAIERYHNEKAHGGRRFRMVLGGYPIP